MLGRNTRKQLTASKQMSFGSFKNVTDKLFGYKSYISNIYVY